MIWFWILGQHLRRTFRESTTNPHLALWQTSSTVWTCFLPASWAQLHTNTSVTWQYLIRTHLKQEGGPAASLLHTLPWHLTLSACFSQWMSVSLSRQVLPRRVGLPVLPQLHLLVLLVQSLSKSIGVKTREPCQELVLAPWSLGLSSALPPCVLTKRSRSNQITCLQVSPWWRLLNAALTHRCAHLKWAPRYIYICSHSVSPSSRNSEVGGSILITVRMS